MFRGKKLPLNLPEDKYGRVSVLARSFFDSFFIQCCKSKQFCMEKTENERDAE